MMGWRKQWVSVCAGGDGSTQPRQRLLVVLLLAMTGLSTTGHFVSAAGYTATDLYTLGTPPGFTNNFNQGTAGLIHDALGGQVVGIGQTGGQNHALLWTATATSGIDLHPAGATSSFVSSTNGTQQVGLADNRARLWSGSAASILDLHPTGFIATRAYGLSSTQQVGSGHNPSTSGQSHALLWSGTAASVVDIHPGVGFTSSEAFGTDGTQQVGYAFHTATSKRHATLWSGTAGSAVDLHPLLPPGFNASEAYSLDGTRQVGRGIFTASNQSHATLWSGSANLAVDLHPAGFTYSLALGMDGALQVGYGSGISTGNNPHALLWSGTAASFVDLHALLPAGVFSQSHAYSIDADGNIFGTAANATGIHAIRWSPIPEPSSLVLVGVAAAGLLKRRSA